MLERRMLMLVAALVVLLASAALWNAFVRPPAGVSGGATPEAASPESLVHVSGPALDSMADPGRTAAQPTTAPPPTVLPPVGTGPSYIVLLARSEIRRRIRASAGSTYLNEIVAASTDSILHRWDSRVSTPVRVYFPPTTVANFQPAFLDAVRSAFQRWQEAGVPVRFNLDADSSSAEVRVQWRIQFEGERSGQTDLQWDDDGHLTGGVVTLATFDAKGQPFAPDDVRVLALHEIGHLIGLDHSPDPGDIMYAQPKVRDLSPRDIRTASLLYDLAPGALRVGGCVRGRAILRKGGGRRIPWRNATSSRSSLTKPPPPRTAGRPASPRRWTRASARGSSSRSFPTTQCAASPAGTAASSSPDAGGSARSASTRTARCTFRPATWRRCSAIPPRRSRSSMRSRGRTRSRSACWDAISTAGTARTGSPVRRCGTTRRVCSRQTSLPTIWFVLRCGRERSSSDRRTTSRSSPPSGRSTCSRWRRVMA